MPESRWSVTEGELETVARRIAECGANELSSAFTQILNGVISHRDGAAYGPYPRRMNLLHAALVGLTRGATRDAFGYASSRVLKGRPLIEHELLSARLADIAIAEATCDLRLGGLSGSSLGSAERVEAEVEICRLSLGALVEAAHVHGGWGFAGDDSPPRRIEAANATILSLTNHQEGNGDD